MCEAKFFLFSDLRYLSIVSIDLSFLDFGHGPEVFFLPGLVGEPGIAAGHFDVLVAHELLEAFEALPEDEKRVFTVEFLRRAVPFDSGPFDDLETADAADDLLANLG